MPRRNKSTHNSERRPKRPLRTEEQRRQIELDGGWYLHIGKERERRNQRKEAKTQ